MNDPPTNNNSTLDNPLEGGPPEIKYSIDLADYMLLIIALLLIVVGFQSFRTFDEKNLVMTAVMFAYISIITNGIIIFKIYHTDHKTRPWVAKLEGLTTEFAWAILKWRQYGAPILELIKGMGIFQKFYERVSGQKLDLKKYVRSGEPGQNTEVEKKEGREPEVKPKKAKVWKREDVQVDISELRRPQHKY